MAALTGPVVLAYGGGSGAPRWVVLSFQKVTAADTFDLSTLTNIPPFTSLTAAVFVATSTHAITTTLGTVAGTVATVVGTGIANDPGLLFAVGA